MDIHVDDSAEKWLREEFGLSSGDSVRIMTRYGDSAFHPGFALTLSAEKPDDVVGLTDLDGIKVFVKEQDAWYFKGMDVYMHYDAEQDELEFDIK